jgi:hypothetical protein
MRCRVPILLMLSAPPLAACFQEIDTGAAKGVPAVAGNSTVDASLPPPGEGAGCNANGCGCNATGSCALGDCAPGSPACPSGTCFLQYGAGGGSFCQPALAQTPPAGHDEAGNAVTDQCQAVEIQSQGLRSTYCAGCHQSPANQGQFNFILNDSKLTTSFTSYPVDGGFWRYVVPGDCDDSFIYYRIRLGQTIDPATNQPPALGMPPAGLPRPAISDLSVLREWINCLGGNPLGLGGGDAGSAGDADDMGDTDDTGEAGDAGDADAGY